MSGRRSARNSPPADGQQEQNPAAADAAGGVGAALVPAPQDLAAAIQGAVAGPLAALGEQLRVISDRLVAVEGAAAPAAVQDAQPGRAVVDADAEAAALLFPADPNACCYAS